MFLLKAGENDNKVNILLFSILLLKIINMSLPEKMLF